MEELVTVITEQENEQNLNKDEDFNDTTQGITPNATSTPNFRNENNL